MDIRVKPTSESFQSGSAYVIYSNLPCNELLCHFSYMAGCLQAFLFGEVVSAERDPVPKSSVDSTRGEMLKMR